MMAWYTAAASVIDSLSPWSADSMPDRRFRIGEIVQLLPPISRHASGGVYVVTKQLPESAGEYEYRIKSINEPHERVVRQSELSKA
jgi:hypothetical protein